MIQSFKNYLSSFSVRQVQDQWATLTSLEQRDLIIKTVAAAALLSLIAAITAYAWPTRRFFEVKQQEPVRRLPLKEIVILRGKIDGQGKLQGQGAREFPTTFKEKKEEGVFQDSVLTQGRREYYNGQIHEGTFKGGKLVSGSITFADKGIWSGLFKDGQLDGEDGMQDFSERRPPVDDDAVAKKGRFVEGRLVSGTITTGKGVTLTGTFDKKENLQGPEGRIDYPKIGKGEGLLFEAGEFNDNQLQGQGKRKFRFGDVYEGTFYRGELVKGTVTYQNGTVHQV